MAFLDFSIALMRVFPKAIVLTTKSHFHVKRTYASIRGLVVRTMTSRKTRISAIIISSIYDCLLTCYFSRYITVIVTNIYVVTNYIVTNYSCML